MFKVFQSTGTKIAIYSNQRDDNQYKREDPLCCLYVATSLVSGRRDETMTQLSASMDPHLSATV